MAGNSLLLFCMRIVGWIDDRCFFSFLPFPSALQSSSSIILAVLFASVVVETPAIRSRTREAQDTSLLATRTWLVVVQQRLLAPASSSLIYSRTIVVFTHTCAVHADFWPYAETVSVRVSCSASIYVCVLAVASSTLPRRHRRTADCVSAGLAHLQSAVTTTRSSVVPSTTPKNESVRAEACR